MPELAPTVQRDRDYCCGVVSGGGVAVTVAVGPGTTTVWTGPGTTTVWVGPGTGTATGTTAVVVVSATG